MPDSKDSISVQRVKAVKQLKALLNKKINFHQAVSISVKDRDVSKDELILLINYEKAQAHMAKA